MIKKITCTLILAFLIALSNTVKAQTDTVFLNFKKDTLNVSKAKEQQDEREKLYELKKDIEKMNAKTTQNSPKKRVVITDTVYVRKERVILGKPPRFYRHEVGVETGAFFNQIFRLFGLVKDTQSFPVSPYVIAYKYRPNEKGAVRLGMGVNSYKLTENRGNFADSKIVKKQSYNVRLGYEFNIPLDDRWLSYIGVDGVFGSNDESTAFDSGFDTNIRTTKSKALGVAFVLGIRYDFSWRVSLGSEMGFQFVNREGEEINEFTANPQFNTIIRKFTEQETKFIGPGNVYISIRF
jgi:hypothetical protein